MSAPICIFDVDGVLVDTFAANADAYQHACRALGLPEPDPAEIRRLLGRPAEEMARRLGCPPERVEEFIEGYARPRYHEALRARAIAFPGVGRVLEVLRDRGVHIAAWTIGPTAQQEMVLSLAGLRRWVELLHAHGANDYPKPDPRGLEEIVARLGAGEPRYLIDDRGEMMAGASRIGARRVFAAYGYGGPGDDPPDAVIEAPEDLLPIVFPES